MNKYFKIIVLGILVSSTVAISAPPDFNLDFNYQGQLLDNGSPANDDYDITIEAFDAVTDGATLSFGASEHIGVTVTNGLFSIDTVNLEIYQYTSDPMWLEIKVRKTSVGGAYDTLTPRQKHQAAPLARTIISDYADFGEVLTHGAYGWIAQPNVHFSGDYDDLSNTPWVKIGGDIGFTTGSVTIGADDVNARLTIRSTGNPASFYGGNSFFIPFYENGLYRAYMGSWQGAAEDFEIGTSFGSGSMHIVTGAIPRITVDSEGDTTFTGKIKSAESGDADMKAYIYGSIGSLGNIYNDGSSSGFSVNRESTGHYRITFDTAIASSTAYVVSTSVFDGSVPQIATFAKSTTFFDVHIWNIAGIHVNSAFDFVVYKK